MSRHHPGVVSLLDVLAQCRRWNGGGQVNVMAIMVCNMSNRLSWLQCMYHIDTEHISVGGVGCMQV